MNPWNVCSLQCAPFATDAQLLFAHDDVPPVASAQQFRSVGEASSPALKPARPFTAGTLTPRASARRVVISSQEQLYGVFADSDSDGGGGRRKRGKETAKKVDFTAPVGFVKSAVINDPSRQPEDDTGRQAGLGAGPTAGLGLGFRSAGVQQVWRSVISVAAPCPRDPRTTSPCDTSPSEAPPRAAGRADRGLRLTCRPLGLTHRRSDSLYALVRPRALPETTMTTSNSRAPSDRGAHRKPTSPIDTHILKTR